MSPFLKNILQTVIGAAIVGNFVFLWNVNARLARIETVLKIQQAVKSSSLEIAKQ